MFAVRSSRNRIPGITYISSAAEVEAVFAVVKPKVILHVACPDSTIPQPSCKPFVNTSTSSVYHENLTDLIDADENLPVLQYPAPKRVYTLTKAEAEAEILAANRENGDSSMLTVSLRPATALEHAIPYGKAKLQMGPRDNLYDFIYISNLVDVDVLAAEALVQANGKPPPPPDMRMDGESFNATNDEHVKFWEFQRAIAAPVGILVKDDEIRVIPVWVALTMATISEWTTWIRTFGKGRPIVTHEAVHLATINRTDSREKSKRILGYKPKFSMSEGLEIPGIWFREEAEKEAEGRETSG
ncbi:NAD(P)-binding protein [Hypoxylon sp. NC1633]|nr:NAD(P)-binding protein [Hypoxylon sp. NC1633]